jgi:uncharacterized membrane protein
MIFLSGPAINRFCTWLDQTSMSQYIQIHTWVIPSVQTVHILAIASVMASALLIDLRLLGIFGRDQSLQSVCKRFLPVIWVALPILLVTGTILIIGEPARALKNPVFQLKIVLILAAIALTGYFQYRLTQNPDRYDPAKGVRAKALLIAIPSLALWIGIVLAGRWIAYVL